MADRLAPSLAGAASALVVLGGLLVAARSAAADPSYPGIAASYALRSAPHGVAVGDLNGDHGPDLVMACPGGLSTGSQVLTVLLGTGSGGFRPGAEVATGGQPWSVAVGDLNEDGHLDVVATIRNANMVEVFLGNGDGTFRAPADLGTGSDPVSTAMADLNGDGHLDLVTVNDLGGSLTVRLGHGDGTVATRSNLEAGTSPWAVAIGDLDRDGHPDLVVSHISGTTVSVLLGDGSGGFGAPAEYDAGVDPTGIALGDFNDDGALDVATGSTYYLGGLEVLFGRGDGTLGPPQPRPAPGYAYALAAADLNRDGHTDLIATSTTGVFTVWLGDGSGDFLPRSDQLTGTEPVGLAIADLNGDSLLDVVTANNTASSVSVHFGNGDGTFGAPPVRLSTDSNLPTSIAIGDLNGDGQPDLVAGTDARLLLVWRGDGHGHFGQRIASESAHETTRFALADLDGDGHLDVVTAHSTGVAVLFGAGDGSLGGEASYPIGAAARWVAVGDVSGDGVPDVAATRSGGVAVLLGRGDGTLGPSTLFPTGGISPNPDRVEIGRVNDDGTGDLVVSSQDYSPTVLLALGSGAFAPPVAFDAGNAVSSFALTDIDGDRRLDVVAGQTGARTASVILGHGDGTFAPPVAYPVGSGPLVAVGRFDGDTLEDLATANAYAGTVTLWHNAGGGVMAGRTDLVCGGSPQAVAAGDLNGDGVSDLAIASYPASITLILSGTEPPPRLLERFQGLASAAGVQLQWRFMDPARWSGVQVQRAEPGAGAWTSLSIPVRDEGGISVAEDSAAPSDGVSWYRLSTTDVDGSVVVTGPIRPTASSPTPIPVPATLALSAPVPNPGRGSLRFSFTLSRDGEARVTVLDLQGRVVATPAGGNYTAGPHSVTWNALSTDRDAPPGLYFLRLRAEGRTVIRRAALLR